MESPELDGGIFMVPPQASSIAGPVDVLFWSLVGMSAIIVLLVLRLMLNFGIRFRAGNEKVEHSLQLGLHTRHMLELAWILPVGVIFIVLFVWAGSLYMDMFQPARADVTINVIGKQWMWKVYYPNGTREINTLHVPVGEVVRLRMTSKDVIHSFFVPAFRLKHDVLPNRYTYLQFTATRPGVYHLFCAEYCGTEHSRMGGKVVVMSRRDYADWLGQHEAGQAPSARGEWLFSRYGCTGCHVGSDVVRAPSLAGLYNKPVQLADGSTIIADAAYLRDSIMLPGKHVVAGYQPVMPSYQGAVSEGEVLQLIAYIKTLEPATP